MARATPNAPERQYGLDVLRCISIYYAVIAHAAAVLLTYPDRLDRWFTGTIITAIAFLNIPSLLMITGALMLSPRAAAKEPTPGVFYRNRLGKLAIPLVAWSFLYYVRNHFTEGTSVFVPTFLKRLATITMEGHLWYLYMLLGVYLVLPFVRALDIPRQRSLGWWLVGVIFSLHVANFASLAAWGLPLYHKFSDDFISIYLGYVVLGWLLYSGPVPSRRLTPLLLLILVGGVVGTVWLQYEHTFVDLREDNIYFQHFSPFHIATGVSCFLLFRQAPWRFSPFWARWLLSLSACSYGIYLVHILVLQFFTGVIGNVFDGSVLPSLAVPNLAAMGVPELLGVVLLSVLIYLVSWGIALVIRRIPYLRAIMP
ncbi:MAG: acyltransferase family protein [Desulfovibrio sp.]|nr:acyltransferase family protein [Desulfovibrio sp.]MCA1986913.1 acyltransferase family protein [Desulfovibrio sp.]